MNFIALFVGAALPLAAAAAAAQTPPRVPFAYESIRIKYDVRGDGLSTESSRFEIRVNSAAGAGAVGQMPVYFSDTMETVEIVEAYTLKQNGKKLPVDAGAILTQLQPGNPQVPMFTDLKQKVIVFPNLRAGDSIVWATERRQLRPRVPGGFMMHHAFSPIYAINDAVVTIETPASMTLGTSAYGIAFERKRRGDKMIYRWNYSNPDPLPNDPAVTSAFDREPRLFASSFKNYEEFGRAYAKLALPKIEVSSKVRALAAEITAGVTDRRQQAQSIYEWVSRNIRYVAIYLDNGGLEPHDPDTIIDNGYGDCKDHAVLFAALLKAKRIESDLVLLNYGDAYSLSEAPTLAQLNHMISFLPEFDLYADTTIGLSPFGTLALEEYGKRVVHVGAKDAELRQIPTVASGAATMTTRTFATLAPDGKVSGRTVTAGTGPMALILRQIAVWTESEGPDRVAYERLRSMGQEGSASIQAKPITALSDDYSISESFEIQMSPRKLSGDSFIVPVGLQLTPRPGDLLMGPLNRTDMKDDEKTPCYSGRQTEEISLALPAGKKAARLPKDVSIENPHLKFTSQWRSAGDMIIVRRDFVSKIDAPLCEGPVRAAVAPALRDIREDYRSTISLADK